jgi:hypothetical protein
MHKLYMSHNIRTFKINNHNIKKNKMEMHKLCHVAIFYCATHHNIWPFKMNNHNEKKYLKI